MTSKIWIQSDNDTIQYESITPETLQGGLEVIQNSFFKYETVAIACDVSENEPAAKELEELSTRAARDGCSIVAIDKTNGKVVGVAFNKLQVRNNAEDGTYFENFARNCKYESSRALVQFMNDADAYCNLFEHYNVDALLEIMFLAVLPEYWKRNIATKLCEASIELARTLLRGEMVKVSIETNPSIKLELEPIPKVVSAIFTAINSQRIGRKLNFTKLAEVSYEKFLYNGIPFYNKIGHLTPTTTLESIKL